MPASTLVMGLVSHLASRHERNRSIREKRTKVFSLLRSNIVGFTMAVIQDAAFEDLLGDFTALTIFYTPMPGGYTITYVPMQCGSPHVHFSVLRI